MAENIYLRISNTYCLAICNSDLCRRFYIFAGGSITTGISFGICAFAGTALSGSASGDLPLPEARQAIAERAELARKLFKAIIMH